MIYREQTKRINSVAKKLYKQRCEWGANIIKDKEGELLTYVAELNERWEEGFSELLKPVITEDSMRLAQI